MVGGGLLWVFHRRIISKFWSKERIGLQLRSREYKNSWPGPADRIFLKALKKKLCSEDDDLLHYCHLSASISRDLVLRRRLDLYKYRRCQRFLQGLPERVVMEIFYRYETDMEDDDSLNFWGSSGNVWQISYGTMRLTWSVSILNLEKKSLPPPILLSLSHIRHTAWLRPTRLQTLQEAIQEEIRNTWCLSSCITSWKG